MVASIGILGLGAFGSFVADRARELVPQLKVSDWDVDSPSVVGDFETVLQSDAVVFAVPPAEYVRALRRFVRQMRPDGIIVDVCTVKMATVAALREVANGRPYIAAHPMFGRQSYIDQGNSLEGLQLVVCEHTLDRSAYRALITFLTGRVKLDVVKMTPEEHDEWQAEGQLLPQHIGCSVRRAGFALNSRVRTVSGAHFYRAMKIVENDEQLFLQASKLNSYWPKVLARYELAEAEHKLEMLNGK